MHYLDLKNITKSNCEETILQALQTVFNLGIKEKKLTAALRCLELLAKKYNLIRPVDSADIDLSPANLEKLYTQLKEKKTLSDIAKKLKNSATRKRQSSNKE